MYIPLYKRIYHELRGRIREGAYRPGERLPGEHELCRHYRSSRRPVRDALTRLGQDGLLANHPGVGWEVVADRPERRLLLVTAAGFEEDSAVCQSAMATAVAGQGLSVEVRIACGRGDTLPDPQAWGGDGYEGIVLLYRSWMGPAWVRAVAALGHRTVLLRCDDHVSGMDTVDMDNAAAMRRIVAHLVARGRRRILYATSAPLDQAHPSFARRRSAFRHEVEGHGLPLLELCCEHNDWSFPPDEKALVKTLRTKKIEAIVVPDWQAARSLMMTLARHRLASDALPLGLVCPTGAALPPVASGPACAVLEPMAAMAAMAAHLASGTGITPHLHLLPGAWQERLTRPAPAKGTRSQKPTTEEGA